MYGPSLPERQPDISSTKNSFRRSGVVSEQELKLTPVLAQRLPMSNVAGTNPSRGGHPCGLGRVIESVQHQLAGKEEPAHG
jgi:hypothetical protein